MGTAAYRKAEACAACGESLVAAEAYLSGDGPVCEACHRAAATAERGRNVAREANVGVLLSGIFSTLGGVTLLATGLFLPPAVPVRVCLVAAGVIVSGVITVRRTQATAAHGTLGRALVALGAIAGALGLVAIVARLAV